MADSSIEWTNKTWHPTTGCDKISAGCRSCYAEVMARRLKAMGQEKYKNEFKLTLHPKDLLIPFQWQKPVTIFVDSMSDLFHKDVPLEFIQRVFRTMNALPRHTFQVLTKRSEELETYSPFLNWTPNIWMGVSVEDNRVITRIDRLRNTGAITKFVSLEPLIGPLSYINLTGIDWAIIGGESGRSARPMHTVWVEEILDQCRAFGTAPFVKQLGKYLAKKYKLQSAKGGDWDEWPESLNHLKIREYPALTTAV